MKRDTSTINLEPMIEDEEGELSSSVGCLIFIGTVIFAAVLIVAFVAKFFNSKMF